MKEILEDYHIKLIEAHDRLKAERELRVEAETELRNLKFYVSDLLDELNGVEVPERIWPLMNEIENKIKE